ncbi:B3/4 domain-containing protein [Streptomyces boninensis]|uniref:B3/B4 domain-containing protein n=1 Tax=Streptomyces boninensis TaxID=2039455 RepID=UPI003B20E6C7
MTRTFHHSAALWADHPDLVAGVLHADGLDAVTDSGPRVAAYTGIARERLAGVGTESELGEIQAWRRAFAAMGLKPTQYRCASESLLRRLRKEGELPRIHPLVDLCNAVSVAYAIPVAAIDASRVAWPLQVRHAEGDETYETFGGTVEHPQPGEVTFADAGGRSHARRWTNRQSGYSAVGPGTTEVLIVAEALHDTAAQDVPKLIAALGDELRSLWGAEPRTGLLTPAAPRFELPGS